MRLQNKERKRGNWWTLTWSGKKDIEMCSAEEDAATGLKCSDWRHKVSTVFACECVWLCVCQLERASSSPHCLTLRSSFALSLDYRPLPALWWCLSACQGTHCTARLQANLPTIDQAQTTRSTMHDICRACSVRLVLLVFAVCVVYAAHFRQVPPPPRQHWPTGKNRACCHRRMESFCPQLPIRNCADHRL